MHYCPEAAGPQIYIGLGYVVYVNTILIHFKPLTNHDSMAPANSSHFLPPGSKGHWYLHQVLQSIKDGKQANPADRMLHNRSLDSQLKGEPSWTGSLDYTN